MALVTRGFVVQAAAQVGAVAGHAHGRGRARRMKHAVTASVVLDSAAVLPLLLVVALQAGRLSVRSTAQIGPVAARAVLIGQAIVRPVRNPAENRGVAAGPAVPDRAVALVTGRLVIISAAQVGPVTGRAILKRLAIIHGMPMAVFVLVVLDAAAILPFSLGVALQAGRGAARAAVQVLAVAGRAVLVRQAIVRFVKHASQIDGVGVRPAVRARPDLAVAFGAGRLAVRAALQIGPMALRADAFRPAGIGSMKDALQVERVNAQILAAVGIGPEGSVAAGAGGLPVGAALKVAPVAGAAVFNGIAVAIGMFVAAEVDGVVEVDFGRAWGPGPHGILGQIAG